MRFLSKRKIPIAVIAIAGVLCTLVMLLGRLFAESKDRGVSCAIEYETLCVLAEKSEKEPSDWLKALREAGLCYLIITDENQAEGLALAEKCDVKSGRSGTVAQSKDSFLMPPLSGDRIVTDYALSGDPSVPLILIENMIRKGVEMPQGFDPEAVEAPLVKGFYMHRDYSDSYEESELPCESENIMFRAVFERGMRMVILTPLYQGEKMVAEIQAYTDMLEGLARRIEVRGLHLGEEFSALSAPVLRPWLLGGAFLLAVAIFTFLISLVFSISDKLEWLILSLSSVIAVVAAVAMPALAQKLGSLAGAIIFSSVGAIVLMKAMEGKDVFGRCSSVFLRMCLLFASILLVGLSGGLYVAALLGTRSYMMGCAAFYGVKLSQFLPIGFSVFVLARTLYVKKQHEQNAFSFKTLWPQCLVLVLCLSVILIIMMLRSGDTALPIAALEKRGRDWLEQVLYARPRTKEMLLAFPAVGVFVFFCEKKTALYQLLFGTILSIGYVSVVNTFCHIVTPIHVSLLRTLSGAGIGLCLAFILLTVLMFIFGKKGVQKDA